MNDHKKNLPRLKGLLARSSKKAICIGGIAVLLGLIAFSITLSVTSSTSFCLSCHEMEEYKAELKFSTHFKDYDGKEVDCNQCHLPRGIGPRYFSVKTYSGLKDLYVHFLTPSEPLDRKDLQVVARRFVDDASCLSCHEDLYVNAKGDAPISELGKVSHDAYNGKDGVSYRNCVACHVNIAHLPRFDRRLDINQDFAERLERKEAYQ